MFMERSNWIFMDSSLYRFLVVLATLHMIFSVTNCNRLAQY